MPPRLTYSLAILSAPLPSAICHIPHSDFPSRFSIGYEPAPSLHLRGVRPAARAAHAALSTATSATGSRAQISAPIFFTVN